MDSTRYEIKLTCDEQYLPNVRSWVRLHPDAFSVAYPPRQVNSLYFDTYESSCLNDNLIGVSYRKKLRFRWYGTDYAVVKGVLELKCKSNQLGWKEHRAIPTVFDFSTITWYDLMQQLKEHADDQFAVWLAMADRPTLINSYWREYYESTDQQLRVTIDYDQRAWEQVSYNRPNLNVGSLLEKLVVVEVKSDAALYHRVSNALTAFPAQVSRNSKFVNGVTGGFCFL